MLYDKRWEKLPQPKLSLFDWLKSFFVEEEIEKGPVDAAGQVLLDAADYIEEHGWCRYVLQNTRGSVCTLGAIQMVTSTSRPPFSLPDIARTDSVRRLALDRFGDFVGDHTISKWNDQSYRTKKQVISALRKAAYK